MKNKKRIYESLITIQGEILNTNCPSCDGDGYSLEDNTNASGGTMNPSLCSLCEGNGVITEELVTDIKYDDECNQYITYKGD